MTEHHRTLLDDLDQAPVGAAPVALLVSGARAARRRKRRALVASAAAVAVLVAGGGLVTAQVIENNDADGSLAADRQTEAPSAVADRPRSTPDSPFDSLDMTLTLLEPRPDGLIPSRLTVQNNSDETVTDPGCRLGAMTHASGLAPATEPDSGLLNPGSTFLVDCAGPFQVPPGYKETLYGPTFRTEGLDAGSYLAVLDYGTLRTERVTTPLEVP